MKEQEKLFIKGFNNGYLLRKYEPDLIKKIVHTIHPLNDYLDGFLSGKEEFELENSQKELKDLRRVRNQSLDREEDLEKGL